MHVFASKAANMRLSSGFVDVGNATLVRSRMRVHEYYDRPRYTERR